MTSEKFSTICKALGDSNRLEIMKKLSGGELCACRLLEAFGITQPTLSHHMKILGEAGLVSARKEGKWTYYSVNRAALDEFRTSPVCGKTEAAAAGQCQCSGNAASGSQKAHSHKERALDYFNRKFHCSQAVLAAFADECGLTEKQALKLGACFGSGMRQGEVCGACSGALMVLGMLYGQYDAADMESRIKANEVNDRMMKGFAEASGSYLCRDLLKCDIRTKEGHQYAVEHRLFTEFCPKMVENAVDVLEKIIN